MANKNWFYNSTIKNTVSVFGSLFNNIHVIRKDGVAGNIIKVPLAYGPKQKYLARLDQKDEVLDSGIAIKMPRMSFEISALTYASDKKVSAQKMQLIGYDAEGRANYYRKPTPYTLSMTLSILAKNQGDALQILEQIIPVFNPTHTISTYIYEGFDTSVDMPITLSSVDMTDDYEGDFLSRRTIIYTLSFEININLFGGLDNGTNEFSGGRGDASAVGKNGPIKKMYVGMHDMHMHDVENHHTVEGYGLKVDPLSANSTDSYSIVQGVRLVDINEVFAVTVSDATGFIAGKEVIGLTSGSGAVARTIVGNVLTLDLPDGEFIVGETVESNGATATVDAIEELHE